MTSTLDTDGNQPAPYACGDEGPVRVTHIITGFPPGGAETMLLKLMRHSDRQRFPATVIGLSHWGPIGDALRDESVPTTALGLVARAPDPRCVVRLAGLLRDSRPDVVQTWMYQADVIGGVVARRVTDARIAWALHGSTDRRGSKRNARLAASLGARLSRRVPDAIVSCSHELVERHVNLGYAREPMVVIPNGFEVDRFAPSDEARSSFRQELAVSPDTPLIGLMARLDPAKDHDTALRAARRVVDRRPGARFVLCGKGVDEANARLIALRAELGLDDHVMLLGHRTDSARVTAALDVAFLSSAYSEAFPSVLAEAMACGVPCAATDLGDCREIVGDTGEIVAPRQPAALGDAILRLLDLPDDERRRRAARARARIVEEFEIGAVVRRYEGVYARLAHGPNSPARHAPPAAPVPA